MYIVSACLVGNNCKYSGGNNLSPAVVKFLEDKDYIIVCPEVTGQLPCPRPPAEIVGDKVIDKNGKDVTREFVRGANWTFDTVQESLRKYDCELEGAIVKAHSPSCGVGKIYDGTFTGTLVDGDGLFVRRLRELNIPLYTEEDFE